MNGKVNLKELIECIELNSEQLEEFESYSNYINIKSADLISVPTKFLTMIKDKEEPEELEEWQVEDFELAKDIVKHRNDYKEIPDSYEIDEYDIMEDFCSSFEDEKVSQQLRGAISEKDAFRRFKTLIYDIGIYDQWYDYRDNQVKVKVSNWCERNGFECIENIEETV